MGSLCSEVNLFSAKIRQQNLCLGHFKICLFQVISYWEFENYWLVGWLVVFGFNGPLRQYFSLYRAVSQREGDRGEKGKMRIKMSKQPAPAPTVIQIVGRPSAGRLPNTIAPSDHSLQKQLGKQCKSRWGGSLWAASSGSILFTNSILSLALNPFALWMAKTP